MEANRTKLAEQVFDRLEANTAYRLYVNYLIFYRGDSAWVTIIHILHGASDYASLIFSN